METSRLNQWLTHGGNAAVLIGLLLLVYELNQTRELTRAQMRDEISDGIFELLTLTADNAQLADLLVRADSGQPLTDAEYFQYASRTRAMYRYFENVHDQFRQRLYDEPEYERQTVAWANYVGRSARAVEVWCSYKGSVSADFANKLDSLLTAYTCE